jgi:hypothetical protein
MSLLEALDAERKRLQAELEKVYRAIKDFGGKETKVKGKRKGKRRWTTEARANMAKAQKARWAKIKAAKKS